MIYILIRKLLPEKYEHDHQKQGYGFSGDNLAQKHRKAILARAQSISGNSIIPLSNTKFHVVSQSNSDRKYFVDTQMAICNCPDFPRIRLCKHLVAVQTQSHPQTLELQSQTQEQIIPQMSSERSSPVASSSLLSEQSLLIPNSASGSRSEALPKWDRLSPNKNLWLETSRNMHVRISPKRRRRDQAVPNTPSSTAQHIGPRGKRKLATYTDPYCGGEQSGKRAKPDAVSAAANSCARSLALSQQGQMSQT